MTHGALLTLSASLLWLLNVKTKSYPFIDKNQDRVHYAPLINQKAGIVFLLV